MLTSVVIFSILAVAGTPGSFRGKIVDYAGPSPDRNWIYVQGRNGMIRRVEISHATVEYDEDVPAAERTRKPQDALVAGTEVRITAEQGSDGEWRATRIEILNSAVSHQPSARSSQPSALSSQPSALSPGSSNEC